MKLLHLEGSRMCQSQSNLYHVHTDRTSEKHVVAPTPIEAYLVVSSKASRAKRWVSIGWRCDRALGQSSAARIWSYILAIIHVFSYETRDYRYRLSVTVWKDAGQMPNRCRRFASATLIGGRDFCVGFYCLSGGADKLSITSASSS